MQSPATMVAPNPYSSAISVDSDSAQMPQYGGIRRLPYLGLRLLMRIAGIIVIGGIAPMDLTGVPEVFSYILYMAIVFSFIVYMIVWFIPVYYRLKNIGMNPWWCLGMLVPLLNILIAVRCLVLPEGYADTKKLDTAGKVLTCVFLGFLILAISAIVSAIVASVVAMYLAAS